MVRKKQYPVQRGYASLPTAISTKEAGRCKTTIRAPKGSNRSSRWTPDPNCLLTRRRASSRIVTRRRAASRSASDNSILLRFLWAGKLLAFVSSCGARVSQVFCSFWVVGQDSCIRVVLHVRVHLKGASEWARCLRSCHLARTCVLKPRRGFTIIPYYDTMCAGGGFGLLVTMMSMSVDKKPYCLKRPAASARRTTWAKGLAKGLRP